MNGKKITATAVTIAALSSGATALLLNGSSSSPPPVTLTSAAPNGQAPTPTQDSQNALERVLKELQQLRSQVDKLELQQATATQPKQPVAATDSEDNESALPLPAEEVNRKRESVAKAQREFLEDNLVQENKDKHWDKPAQAKLSAAYGAAADNGVRFVDADCRSTMCKVRMALDVPGKPGEMQLRNLMDQPAPWPGPRFMQIDKQTGAVVMYMMREGHELPTLPQE